MARFSAWALETTEPSPHGARASPEFPETFTPLTSGGYEGQGGS